MSGPHAIQSHVFTLIFSSLFTPIRVKAGLILTQTGK